MWILYSLYLWIPLKARWRRFLLIRFNDLTLFWESFYSDFLILINLGIFLSAIK